MRCARGLPYAADAGVASQARRRRSCSTASIIGFDRFAAFDLIQLDQRDLAMTKLAIFRKIRAVVSRCGDTIV